MPTYTFTYTEAELKELVEAAVEAAEPVRVEEVRLIVVEKLDRADRPAGHVVRCDVVCTNRE